MEFKVVCECGKMHPVTAGDAGAKVPCSCGRTVSVPSLGKLRQQGVVPNQAHPVLAINRMLEAGELPAPGGCVRCGVATHRVVRVEAECERVWIRREHEFRWYYVFLPWIVLLPWAANWDSTVKRHGDDVILTLPLRVCDHCLAENRGPAGLEALLRQVPAYDRLLEKISAGQGHTSAVTCWPAQCIANRNNRQIRATRVEIGADWSDSGQPTLPDRAVAGIVSAGRESGPPPNIPQFGDR